MNPETVLVSQKTRIKTKTCEHVCSSNESLDHIDHEGLTSENETHTHGTSFIKETKQAGKRLKPLSRLPKSVVRSTKHAMRPCHLDLCASEGFISDDCASVISTASTMRSFRDIGLHVSCMAKPPDYDFKPNLKRAREEIVMRRRSPSVDATLEAKITAVNRRKEYARNLEEQKEKRRRSSQNTNRNRASSLRTDSRNLETGSETDEQSVKSFLKGSGIPRHTRTEDLQSAYEPVLLDDETWMKIEELVKTENSSSELNRKRTWVYGFFAGILVALALNLLGYWVSIE
ncbi:uncharacterized protein LOC134839622 isoform X2 [Symsagittifera roscoffensis]|uniref:uncharacterized protein LOC134839622 isoform X2 n=1 Tax=Symsagittifera roscoffensis TaxID=84072 RepID=UPI00307C375C